MRDRHHGHSVGPLFAAVVSGVIAVSFMVAPEAAAQTAPVAAKAAKKRPSKKVRTEARGHYKAGMAKFEKKDYAGALKEFQAANALIPAPQAQQKIALCYDGMNDAPNALKAYKLFVEQAKAVTKAKTKKRLAPKIEEANKRIEALSNAPVKVRITSDPPSASLEVDGEVQMGMTPMDLQLKPGKHKIRVSAPNYTAVEKEIDVKKGEEPPAMAFALTPAAATPPAGPAEPPPPEHPEEQAGNANANASMQVGADQGTGKHSNIPAYVTLGFAGASAIVGTIFGVKALGSKSDFNDNPTADGADQAERDALISDMAFGVAVTLGVTGTVLLLSNGDEAAQQAKAKKGLRFAPYVGRTGGGASATWKF